MKNNLSIYNMKKHKNVHSVFTMINPEIIKRLDKNEKAMWLCIMSLLNTNFWKPILIANKSLVEYSGFDTKYVNNLLKSLSDKKLIEYAKIGPTTDRKITISLVSSKVAFNKDEATSIKVEATPIKVEATPIKVEATSIKDEATLIKDEATLIEALDVTGITTCDSLIQDNTLTIPNNTLEIEKNRPLDTSRHTHARVISSNEDVEFTIDEILNESKKLDYTLDIQPKVEVKLDIQPLKETVTQAKLDTSWTPDTVRNNDISCLRVSIKYTDNFISGQPIDKSNLKTKDILVPSRAFPNLCYENYVNVIYNQKPDLHNNLLQKHKIFLSEMAVYFSKGNEIVLHKYC